MSSREFAQQAQEQDNGTFRMVEKVPAVPEEGEPARLLFHRYQDAQGRLTLSPVAPDARWRRQSTSGARLFSVTRNTSSSTNPASFSLGGSPLPMRAIRRVPSLSSIACRYNPRVSVLMPAIARVVFVRPCDDGESPPSIPVACRQGGVVPEETVDPNFTDHGDHVVCRQGKHLKMASFPNTEGGVQFVALQADCQACPIRATCLAPNEKRKYVQISRYELEFRRARRLNATGQYQREMQRRKTVVEGVFARLDRLGWDEARGRGIERVDCQGSIAALAHNILKALTKRRFRKRTALRKDAGNPVFGHQCVGFFRASSLSLVPSLVPPIALTNQAFFNKSFKTVLTAQASGHRGASIGAG